VKVVFDTYGNDKQKLVAKYWTDQTTEDVVYGGSKGSGKSYLGCSLIFGDAFIYPETHYFIARRELTDLRKFTIPSIYEVFEHWGLNPKYYSYNGQDSYFSLHNGSKVFLLAAPYLPSDPKFHRFGSIQMTRGWIEEAGEFEESARDNLAISVGRWKNDVYGIKGKILQTCNPSKNYLYRNYYQRNKSGSLPEHIKFVQAFPEDNKKHPPGYLDMLNRTLKGPEKERLLFGNWEYDDDPSALIEYDKILDCFTNTFVPEGEKMITADIARFGSDSTVIGIWDGLRVKLIQYRHKSVSEVAAIINGLQNQYNVPNSRTIADEDGVGGGVVDILGCHGFVNNSSPLPNPMNLGTENYNNLKSQCYFRLAERINKGGLFIDCKDIEMKNAIIQELEQVKQYNMDKDGKRQVLPKDKVKEVLGRSPDFADTIMMREWFDLKPKFEVLAW